MKIVVVGNDARASAIATLLAGGGYAVSTTAEGDGSAADVVVLAGPRSAAEPPAVGVTPDTILIDAMSGHPNAETERALGRHYGTDRIVRALIVLPQPGANILFCGDDPATMHAVERIVETCDCVPGNRGPLSNLDELEPDEGLDDQYDRLKDANTVSNP